MHMKIETLFDYIKGLCKSDLDRVISFVLGIVSANQQIPDRPDCPYCGGSHVIKFGHIRKKQRFLCHGCGRTFMHTTNTLMAQSHYQQSVWFDFIRDTLCGESLDDSAEKFKFSHQTAFNMRHKVLMALQDIFAKSPVVLSGVAEFDETFVLNCYKGAPVPEKAERKARKHGAKATKRGISNEYIAICTGIQRNGGIIAETVNRAKPSSKELISIFDGRIAENTLVLTDGLRSYKALESLASCAVVDVNQEENKKMFNLNTVNSLHSFIKSAYTNYRGVATKYINRYNALFSVAFRHTDALKGMLLDSLCTIGQNCYWHRVKDIRNYRLIEL